MLLALDLSSGVDRCPNPRGRQRHFQDGDAQWVKCIQHGADNHGWGSDPTSFTATFGAKRIVGARLGFVQLLNQALYVLGARDSVVHERAREQLTARIVNAVLTQRLTETLRDAALDLAFNNHRIDYCADVVDAPITNQIPPNEFLRVDFDLAGACAVAPGEARRIVH